MSACDSSCQGGPCITCNCKAEEANLNGSDGSVKHILTGLAMANGEGIRIPAVAAQGCSMEYFCTDSTACANCYGLNSGVCYNGELVFNQHHDSSIRVSCSAANCLVEAWTSPNCAGSVEYSSTISSSCNMCYVVNPLLTFMINGNHILTHGLGDPQDKNFKLITLDRVNALRVADDLVPLEGSLLGPVLETPVLVAQ